MDYDIYKTINEHFGRNEKIKATKNGIGNNQSQMRHGAKMNGSNEYFRLD